ncbi:MAG: hypothetical protein FWE55_05250, partial [Synergistaceae bacterium]|nr:hypothetical protein [Synergistaceae bacterium]
MSGSSERNNNKPFGGAGGGPRFGPRFGRPPRQGLGADEKAKDFKKSWGQLIQYGRNYTAAIVIALTVAAIGTVFSFISPDRLREMTDEIVKG